MSILQLPLISVQPDWQKVTQEVASGQNPEALFWIACYVTGKPSVQGFIRVIKKEGGNFGLEGKDGFSVVLMNSHMFKIEHSESGLKDIIVNGPKTEINLAEKTSISCIDVSQNSKLFAAAIGSKIMVGNITEEKAQKTLTGHLNDVTVTQFFPSNLVLLSGGTDFQLKIWSVLDGSNPVTLKGHKSAITSTAIIEKGRNVLSSSRDGTIKLWNCGTSSVIDTFGNFETAINKMVLAKLPPTYRPAVVDQLELNEVGTEDKLVLVALDDGSVHGFHLGTRAKLFSSEKNEHSLTALAYDETSSLVFTGNVSGQICIYALTRGLKEPIVKWQRNKSAITSLVLKLSKNGESVLCVSCADGGLYQTSSLATIYEPVPKIFVEVEYTGNDLEKISDMKILPSEEEGYQEIICSVRDGKVRIY